MASLRNSKIGIFDSGVGGLTVLKEVRKMLPYEDFVYFGDTARVPYGNRPKEEIISFSLEIVEFLLKEDLKALIIACNTIDSAAISDIKSRVDIPVFGVIRSGAEYAWELSPNKRIGLIATKGTVNSKAYDLELDKMGIYKLEALAVPEFVEIVERGQREGLGPIISDRLSGINNSDIDALILGCTHFPAIEKEIRAYLRDDIKIVNPAIRLGEGLSQFLGAGNLNKPKLGQVKYYVTGNGEKFEEVGENILGHKLDNVQEISL